MAVRHDARVRRVCVYWCSLRFFFGLPLSSGGFTREVASHFVFVAVRLLGGGWRLRQRALQLGPTGCEQSLVRALFCAGCLSVANHIFFFKEAVLEHAASGALLELDLAVAPPASCVLVLEGTAGGRVEMRDWTAVDGREEQADDLDEARGWTRQLAGDTAAMPSVQEALFVAQIVETLLE
jgi:hypothetical protein